MIFVRQARQVFGVRFGKTSSSNRQAIVANKTPLLRIRSDKANLGLESQAASRRIAPQKLENSGR